MKITKALIFLPAFFLLLCSGSCNNDKKKLGGLTYDMARKSLMEKYPKLPTDEIFRQATNGKLLNELKDRYKRGLNDLAIETDRDGAKLVVVIMSPDVGRSLSLANTSGIPYIQQLCNTMGIDCLDMTPAITTQHATSNGQSASEGNFNKAGAAVVAEQLSYLMLTYDCFKNNKPFPAGAKPETFGDAEPSKKDVIDEENGVKYYMTTNAQGLRMDHNITFPKKKQTIYFMGNAQIYSPLLDDKSIATHLLQEKYPNKEIINAGYLNYTMEDYASLYVEKGRYTEPDVVVVCTSGEDILSNFFTQRNRFARSKKIYKPSPVEDEFYSHLN